MIYEVLVVCDWIRFSISPKRSSGLTSFFLEETGESFGDNNSFFSASEGPKIWDIKPKKKANEEYAKRERIKTNKEMHGKKGKKKDWILVKNDEKFNKKFKKKIYILHTWKSFILNTLLFHMIFDSSFPVNR